MGYVDFDEVPGEREPIVARADGASDSGAPAIEGNDFVVRGRGVLVRLQLPGVAGHSERVLFAFV